MSETTQRFLILFVLPFFPLAALAYLSELAWWPVWIVAGGFALYLPLAKVFADE
jgi:hypothetical protein